MALEDQSCASRLYQFSASFRAFPGRNLGTLAALILIAAPVRGLRPLRAARLPTAKVPNPTSDTAPPFLSVVFTAPIIDSSARVAAALEISACLAMCSISSVLFTGPLVEKIVEGCVSSSVLVFPLACAHCAAHRRRQRVLRLETPPVD